MGLYAKAAGPLVIGQAGELRLIENISPNGPVMLKYYLFFASLFDSINYLLFFFCFLETPYLTFIWIYSIISNIPTLCVLTFLKVSVCPCCVCCVVCMSTVWIRALQL